MSRIFGVYFSDERSRKEFCIFPPKVNIRQIFVGNAVNMLFAAGEVRKIVKEWSADHRDGVYAENDTTEGSFQFRLHDSF